ncbi:hypothetical protein HKX42_02015 [Salinisphaera sp. USBA-960]|uniref:hypothetical protein n=1 Tax=Salinisphaera orenii TaxID=856731 RepID=UPI000DBE733B|nr:hypothetical protein [Salifodinibacter halophilus]NNC25652.1 hypothetical protein [Salifodinibacter halophilus]
MAIRYAVFAILCSAWLSACATNGANPHEVRILKRNASVPHNCKALGEITTGGMRTRAWRANYQLRLNLRQNAAYRFHANTVHIEHLEQSADGLLAQGTAYNCP